MARITVEDCVGRVHNRFELVMLASRRARSLTAGARLTVDRDHDRNAVVALREIAAGTLDLGDLSKTLEQSLTNPPPDRSSIADDVRELIEEEQAALPVQQSGIDVETEADGLVPMALLDAGAPPDGAADPDETVDEVDGDAVDDDAVDGDAVDDDTMPEDVADQMDGRPGRMDGDPLDLVRQTADDEDEALEW